MGILVEFDDFSKKKLVSLKLKSFVTVKKKFREGERGAALSPQFFGEPKPIKAHAEGMEERLDSIFKDGVKWRRPSESIFKLTIVKLKVVQNEGFHYIRLSYATSDPWGSCRGMQVKRIFSMVYLLYWL